MRKGSRSPALGELVVGRRWYVAIIKKKGGEPGRCPSRFEIRVLQFEGEEARRVATNFQECCLITRGETSKGKGLESFVVVEYAASGGDERNFPPYNLVDGFPPRGPLKAKNCTWEK